MLHTHATRKCFFYCIEPMIKEVHVPSIVNQKHKKKTKNFKAENHIAQYTFHNNMT